MAAGAAVRDASEMIRHGADTQWLSAVLPHSLTP